MRSLIAVAYPRAQLPGIRCKHSCADGGELHKQLYEVVRQDDNANTFVLARGLELLQAEQVSIIWVQGTGSTCEVAAEQQATCRWLSVLFALCACLSTQRRKSCMMYL